MHRKVSIYVNHVPKCLPIERVASPNLFVSVFNLLSPTLSFLAIYFFFFNPEEISAEPLPPGWGRCHLSSLKSLIDSKQALDNDFNTLRLPPQGPTLGSTQVSR